MLSQSETMGSKKFGGGGNADYDWMDFRTGPTGSLWPEIVAASTDSGSTTCHSTAHLIEKAASC